MNDLRQTEEYANFLKSEGWVIVKKSSSYYFIKNIPLLGHILNVQRTRSLDLSTIGDLCRKYRIFQLIIEPDAVNRSKSSDKSLLKLGFKLSPHPFLPTKTIQIDLKRPKSRIYKNLKRNIRKGVQMGEGLMIKKYSTPKEIIVFQKAWKSAIKNKRYVPSVRTLLNLRKSFPQNKSLFVASHNISGRIIGGVIFTTSSHDVSNYIIFDSVNYLYGFTTPEGRTSLSHASLLYEGLLWGKKLGCKIFDFEGVYDSRFPNPAWLGFTQFKRSFGGYEVTYPGCFVKTNIFGVKIPPSCN